MKAITVRPLTLLATVIGGSVLVLVATNRPRQMINDESSGDQFIGVARDIAHDIAPKPKSGFKIPNPQHGPLIVEGDLVHRQVIKDLYAFRPTVDERSTLLAMANQVHSIRNLPEPVRREQYIQILESVAVQLGPERAADLWRSLEPGNAQVAKAMDDYSLPTDTVSKWEELRSWGREQRNALRDSVDVQQTQAFEDEFNRRLSDILPNADAYKEIKPIALMWLGAEGPRDYGFGKLE